MRVAVIDEDGDIVRILDVVDVNMVEALIEPGQIIIKDNVPDTTEAYWKQGAWVFRPDRPSAYSNWDPINKAWFDVRTLDSLKADKIKLIKDARLAVNASSFTYSGKKFAADDDSVADIDAVTSEVALTKALPANFAGYWKADDNTQVSIPNVSTWISFYKAFVAQRQANFKRAQSLKDSVRAATTVAQLDAIKLDF